MAEAGDGWVGPGSDYRRPRGSGPRHLGPHLGGGPRCLDSPRGAEHSVPVGSGELLIGSIVTNAARAVPDRPAVVLGDESLTFAALNARANAVAAALTGLGLGVGDRLVTWSTTAIDLAPLFAAAAKLGVIFAPTNAGLSVEEAQTVIEPVRPALLVVDDDRRTTGADLADRLGARIVSLSELRRMAGATDPGEPKVAPLRERDPHVIFFTSGSTGRPKGAILSHRVNFLRSHPGAQLEPRGVMVCPYPLFHMGAWTIILQQWQAREAVVLLASADPATICTAVVEYRATRLNCVPAVWRRVLDHLGSAAGRGLDMTSVRFADAGTSATPVELLTAIAAAFPRAWVRVFYGSTEAGSVAALGHEDLRRKPGSCGTPVPCTETRIEDDGELWVHGPLLFDGYFEDDDATAAALVDGWYRTGDLAECDPEGFLAITGRAKDVIRTGGETVAPLEVETVLAEHVGVAEVAVVGLPDPEWGELVCAVVVASDATAPPTLDDLRAHCVGRLAPYKQPRRMALMASIPRTPSTQQVQRRALVEQLAPRKPDRPVAIPDPS